MIVDFCREDLGLADLLWPAHTHTYTARLSSKHTAWEEKFKF